MTQANEQHLTPKPLDEHVLGAWNFIEPPPTPKLDRLVAIPEPAFSVQPRLTLSPEARRELLGAMPVHDMLYCLAGEACDDPASPEWRVIEDTLMELLAPPRYITGVAQPAPWLSDPHAP